ncbi:phage major capsid protein [Listeria booriae]|uniref:phage major capsid protein n=1 Tax=Listeria booriae TaxID=1552123 RepID=UPI0016236CA9|nr:phage major capsid protein [Listeria booriae]MBC2389067.1 phage major capsid protein [Listeria booriae]
MFKEKIKALLKSIGEKREAINAQVTEALKSADAGDLDKAKEIKGKIDAAKTDLAALEGELKDYQEIDGLEELQDEEGEDRGLGNKKHRKILDDDTGADDFEHFIRTKGAEKRDLTTINTSVVVPVDVVNQVMELKQTEVDLSQLVTVQPVGAGSGKFPIAKRTSAILATKEELEEIAKVDEPMFTDVEYKVETRIGQIVLSNELIEDSAINIKEYVKKQMNRMLVNTNNVNIIAKLSKFKKITGSSTDDIKAVFNIELDPALTKVVLTNQDAFNWLDTQKDANDKYLLQPDLTASSGKSLFGSPVEVVSNALLKSGGTQAAPKYPIVVGDLKEGLVLFKRSEITAEWEKFDRYSQGLSIGVRNDYQQIDEDAVRYIEIDPSVAV